MTEGLIRLFTFVVPALFECCFFLPLCRDASVVAFYWSHFSHQGGRDESPSEMKVLATKVIAE